MKPDIVGRSVDNQRIERLWRDVYLPSMIVFETAFLRRTSHNIMNDGELLHARTVSHYTRKSTSCKGVILSQGESFIPRMK